MESCKYCGKLIQDGEEIKVFRWKKGEKCHLRCYQIYLRMKVTIDQQNGKVSKSPYLLTRERGDPWQIRNTPDGVCPYCDQMIEKDQLTRKFRLIKNKKCHLKCYQDWHHQKWWQWFFCGLAWLIFITFCVWGFWEIFEKI